MDQNDITLKHLDCPNDGTTIAGQICCPWNKGRRSSVIYYGIGRYIGPYVILTHLEAAKYPVEYVLVDRWV